MRTPRQQRSSTVVSMATPLLVSCVVSFLLFAGVITSLSASTSLKMPSHDNYDVETIVELVNSNPASTWTAGVNKISLKDKIMRLESFPQEVQERLIIAELERQSRRGSTTPSTATTSSVSSSPLPVNFDARQQWPDCIHPVLDQGDCGSCWAFASSEVLSDRFCIQSNGAVNVVLSPQNLLSCEKLNLKCELGSLPEWAWSYLQSTGIVTMDCVPYVSGNGSVPACTDGSRQCTSAGEQFQFYQAMNYSQVGDFIEPSHHIEAIMEALLEGPVDATFNVYADFDSYQSGVYQHTYGGYEGLHSVKVIGYGVENGTDYWLVQNSWGTSWGSLGGFFKIIRGIDDCGFESLMYTGFPLLQ